MASPDFWNNQEKAQQTVLQLKGKPGKYHAKVKRTFVGGREVYTSKSA